MKRINGYALHILEAFRDKLSTAEAEAEDNN
jgi:hypothetical protein